MAVIPGRYKALLRLCASGQSSVLKPHRGHVRQEVLYRLGHVIILGDYTLLSVLPCQGLYTAGAFRGACRKCHYAIMLRGLKGCDQSRI